MAKKIIRKLREKAAEVQLDETGAIAQTLAWEAVDAILSEVGSPAWAKYMTHFADTPEQLKRLMLQDDKQDIPEVRKSVAYILANAVCGTQTTTQTYKEVNPGIDDDLVRPV